MKPQCLRHPKGTYFKNPIAGVLLDKDACDWVEIKLFKQMHSQALKAVCTCGWVNNNVSSGPYQALLAYYKNHLQYDDSGAKLCATTDTALLYPSV